MAQTALVVTILKQDQYAVVAGDLTVTMAASDATNGNSFPMTGNEILVVQNTDTVAHTFGVTSVADVEGRVDSSLSAYSVAASAIVAIEASILKGWQEADGNLYLTSSNILLKFGVLRAL
jgi:hypothetical protein